MNSSADLVGHGEKRVPVRDDEVQVYLAAAQVAPVQGDEEWVSILNLESTSVDLAEWKIQDKEKRTLALDGVLQSGEAKVVRGKSLLPVRLPDKGGVIVLLNKKGEQVDRVDYTEKDVARYREDVGRGKPLFFLNYRS